MTKNERVFIKKTINNIENELAKAELFVLSSNYEGMPNALLEAMAQGLPVISTNSSETISTIIKNNENGIIVDKNNQKQLTEKMEYILNNKKDSNKLSEKALKVKKIYIQEAILKKWDNIINEIINKSD